MKNKRILFVSVLLAISVLNPGCRHEKPGAKALYLQYVKSKLIVR